MTMKLLLATGAIAGVVALAGCGGSPQGSSPPAKAHGAKLAVKVTTTTQTWGTVQIAYVKSGSMRKLNSCSSSSCTYTIPRGARVTVSQSPVSSSTWPFKDWSFSNGVHSSTMMGKSMQFRILGHSAAVQAVYVLKSSSGTGSYGSGY